MANLLHISTFGGLSLKLGDEILDSLIPDKGRALIIYLAIKGKPQTRTHLADLFWAESNEEQGLSNLRTLLTRIRPYLQTYLIVNRTTLAFDSHQPLFFDRLELEKIINGIKPYVQTHPGNTLSGEIVTLLEQALKLYNGEFLAGFNPAGSTGFEEWEEIERQSLHNKVVGLLNQLITYYMSQGAHNSSYEWVGRLLQLDPLNEEAHRQQMLLLALEGKPKLALTHYKNYQRYLVRELDIAPEAQTLDLFEDIRRGKIKATTLSQIKSEPARIDNNYRMQSSNNAFAIHDGQSSVIPLDKRLDQLKRVSLFVNTPDEVLQKLANSLKEVRLGAGQMVFEKGEIGQSMYIIVEGKVRVHYGNQILNHLGPRDIFGEMALLDSSPRLATITTIVPTCLWQLEQADLYRLMSDRVEVMKGILAVLSARLRDRVEDLIDINKKLS